MSMGNAALGQSHLQSPLQALVTCTMPRELHEDIQELGKQRGCEMAMMMLKLVLLNSVLFTPYWLASHELCCTLLTALHDSVVHDGVQ